MWEPNDKESREVLNALCRHEPSSVDRRDFSRHRRWLTRFDLEQEAAGSNPAIPTVQRLASGC
jgi:hypothetical protein